MARSAAVIQKQILDYAQANYGTNIGDPLYYIWHDKQGNPITPSATNKWVLIAFIVATAINIFEQLLDLFKVNIEADIAKEPPGSPAWIQNQCFLFQYGDVLQFINFAPSYATVDESKRIITQCAVVNLPVGGYIVKVAASLAPLSTPQTDALTSYLTQLSFGVPFTVQTANPDLLWYGIDVYYDGQYASSIQTDVTDAITAYVNDFNNNNFNGDVVLSKLQDVVQNVTGVNDVVLRQIELRADGLTTAQATKMVDNNNQIIRSEGTYAGYIVIDTDSTGRTTPMINYYAQ